MSRLGERVFFYVPATASVADRLRDWWNDLAGDKCDFQYVRCVCSEELIPPEPVADDPTVYVLYESMPTPSGLGVRVLKVTRGGPPGPHPRAYDPSVHANRLPVEPERPPRASRGPCSVQECLARVREFKGPRVPIPDMSTPDRCALFMVSAAVVGCVAPVTSEVLRVSITPWVEAWKKVGLDEKEIPGMWRELCPLPDDVYKAAGGEEIRFERREVRLPAHYLPDLKRPVPVRDWDRLLFEFLYLSIKILAYDTFPGSQFDLSEDLDKKDPPARSVLVDLVGPEWAGYVTKRSLQYLRLGAAKKRIAPSETAGGEPLRGAEPPCVTAVRARCERVRGHPVDKERVFLARYITHLNLPAAEQDALWDEFFRWDPKLIHNATRRNAMRGTLVTAREKNYAAPGCKDTAMRGLCPYAGLWDDSRTVPDIEDLAARSKCSNDLRVQAPLLYASKVVERPVQWSQWRVRYGDKKKQKREE